MVSTSIRKKPRLRQWPSFPPDKSLETHRFMLFCTAAWFLFPGRGEFQKRFPRKSKYLDVQASLFKAGGKCCLSRSKIFGSPGLGE